MFLKENLQSLIFHSARMTTSISNEAQMKIKDRKLDKKRYKANAQRPRRIIQNYDDILIMNTLDIKVRRTAKPRKTDILNF